MKRGGDMGVIGDIGGNGSGAAGDAWMGAAGEKLPPPAPGSATASARAATAEAAASSRPRDPLDRRELFEWREE